MFSLGCLSFFTGECTATKWLEGKAISTEDLTFTLHTRVRPQLQRQPHRLDHFQDGSEHGAAIGGQRPVQALAAQAGVVALDAWVEVVAVCGQYEE